MRRRNAWPPHRGAGRSMMVRVFFLLVGGLVLSAVLTGGMAWWRLKDTDAVGGPNSDVWATPVAAFVRSLDTVTPAERSALMALGAATGIYAMSDSEVSSHATDSEVLATAALASKLQRPFTIRETHGLRACAHTAWHCYRLQTMLTDGTALDVRITDSLGRNVLHGMSDGRMRGWMPPLALLCVLLLLAAVITRTALAPLKRLVQAAETFADDVDAKPLQEQGPREIRTAVAAFNRMQLRIQAHLAERTSMLAAIAHDLQTPLTRLRLRFEHVDDLVLRQRLITDLDECQSRVREGLDLTRSLDDRTPLVQVDLNALLQSACNEASDAGLPVVYESSVHLTVRARPQALLRCVENLISNAVKYGESARVSASQEGLNAVIRVCDQGPGIAPADLTRVFEPFVRLEQSRSRATGGTGLGLYIVRNLMRRQHGEVHLRNLGEHAGSGLEASLIVPLA